MLAQFADSLKPGLIRWHLPRTYSPLWYIGLAYQPWWLDRRGIVLAAGLVCCCCRCLQQPGRALVRLFGGQAGAGGRGATVAREAVKRDATPPPPAGAVPPLLHINPLFSHQFPPSDPR